MSIQPMRTADHVNLPAAQSRTSVQAIAIERRYSRQASAMIWIVLAWIAGTIIFEITAIGGEPKHVVIETDDKPVTLFFHDRGPERFPLVSNEPGE